MPQYVFCSISISISSQKMFSEFVLFLTSASQFSALKSVKRTVTVKLVKFDISILSS